MPFDFSSNQNASSSQSASSRDDIGDLKIKDNANSANLDSGIISDVIVSSDLSSEVLNVEDDKSLSEPSDRASNLPCDKKTEKEEMSLDSGIISDLSDRICSKSECDKPFKADISTKPIEPKLPLVTLEMLYTQDEDGDTQLHNAVWEECEEMIRYIVFVTPTSELLDIQNDRGQTCLHFAVRRNQPRVTRLLLLAGAKINIEDQNGNTPLHISCAMNHVSCIEALLTPVTPFERKYYSFKYTPNIDSPRKYLNEINYDGLSCLHIAAKTRNLRMIHFLLMNGADVNIKEWKGGFTVLHGAVTAGNTELVRYILHHPRIDLEVKNYAQHTAYQLSSDHSEIAELLLKRNAIQLSFAHEIDESDSEDDSDTDDESTLDERVSRLIASLRPYSTSDVSF